MVSCQSSRHCNALEQYALSRGESRLGLRSCFLREPAVAYTTTTPHTAHSAIRGKLDPKMFSSRAYEAIRPQPRHPRPPPPAPAPLPLFSLKQRTTECRKLRPSWLREPKMQRPLRPRPRSPPWRPPGKASRLPRRRSRRRPHDSATTPRCCSVATSPLPRALRFRARRPLLGRKRLPPTAVGAARRGVSGEAVVAATATVAAAAWGRNGRKKTGGRRRAWTNRPF